MNADCNCTPPNLLMVWPLCFQIKLCSLCLFQRQSINEWIYSPSPIRALARSWFRKTQKADTDWLSWVARTSRQTQPLTPATSIHLQMCVLSCHLAVYYWRTGKYHLTKHSNYEHIHTLTLKLKFECVCVWVLLWVYIYVGIIVSWIHGMNHH